jgi:predicted RND superfamily exporter protein
MYRILGRIIVRAPWSVIAVVVLACVVVLAGLRNTSFVSDYDATLPDHSELTRDIRAIQDKFESRSTLAFLVSGGEAWARMRAACALSSQLEKTPGVAPGRVYGFGSDTLKYVVEEAGDLRVVGLREFCDTGGALSDRVLDGLGPQRSLVVAPGGELVVYADLDVISGEFDAMLTGIDAQIASINEPGVTVAYSGQPAFIAQNDRFSKRIAWFFPVIMILVLLLHWEALRSVQAVVVPIFTGLVATALGLGVYGWLGLPLDTYAVLAPILVLAVGAGHSVQLLKRYMEEVRERVEAGAQASREQNDAAIVATIMSVGPVLTLAVSGAAACLFALLLLDVAALARFGVLAGSGIVGALFLELTLVPAVRVLLPRPIARPRYGELSPFWQTALRHVGSAAIRGPRILIGLCLLLVVVALGVGVTLVKPSHSISVYTASDVPVQKTVHELTAAGVGPYAFDVMIDTGSPELAFEPRNLDTVRELEARLKEDPAVSATLSAASAVDFLQCRFLGEVPCADVRVASPDEASQIWTMLFGGGREVGLVDDTRQFLRVRSFVTTDETQAADRLIAIAHSVAAERSLDISTGGSAVAAKALADGIVRVSIEKGILLVAIVALIGGLAFRSLGMAFAFAIPSIVTVLANFSYLGWSGTSLNVATAAVATIAVGVGLDYLVYIAFRIREGLRRGLSFEDAAIYGHASAGGAAVCVAIAVAVGYIVLLFSPGYLLHHWIAVLVPMTMLSSLFGALFVFPFLLRVFGNIGTGGDRFWSGRRASD